MIESYAQKGITKWKNGKFISLVKPKDTILFKFKDFMPRNLEVDRIQSWKVAYI